jgi:hypothetical protein
MKTAPEGAVISQALNLKTGIRISEVEVHADLNGIDNGAAASAHLQDQ